MWTGEARGTGTSSDQGVNISRSSRAITSTPSGSAATNQDTGPSRAPGAFCTFAGHVSTRREPRSTIPRKTVTC